MGNLQYAHKIAAERAHRGSNQVLWTGYSFTPQTRAGFAAEGA